MLYTFTSHWLLQETGFPLLHKSQKILEKKYNL